MGNPAGRNTATLVGAAALLILAACASNGVLAANPPMRVAEVAQSTPDPSPALTPTPFPSGGGTTVESAVTEIVDGDTIKVAGAAGRSTVRIIGINTPESDECLGPEAGVKLKTLIGDGPVRLTSDTTDKDRYGRWLRYVTNSAGVDVGAEMIRSGFALARYYPPDVARSVTYESLQQQAKDAVAGMWAADACGPPAVATITIDTHPDAAGDDNKNLNGEWVRFTNAGAAVVALDGWVVADESASHRYTFGDFDLKPGSSVTLYSGCGVNTVSQVFWCKTTSAVWNNGGDTVFLRDPSGNNIASLKY